MSDPLTDAEEFRRRFDPRPGVDYEWVLKRAKDNFTAAESTFQQSDAKAGTIITYFGGGTGVAVFAGIAGVAATTITPAVAIAGLPALVAALFAVMFAVATRWPMASGMPPDAERCVRFLNHGLDHLKSEEVDVVGKKAEAATIGVWHEAAEVVRMSNTRKARWLKWATLCQSLGVGLLVLPLALVVFEKLPAFDPVVVASTTASVVTASAVGFLVGLRIKSKQPSK